MTLRSPFSSVAAALIATLVLAGPSAALAQSQYVLYYADYGDWSVTCSRDMLSAEIACLLSAPPPALTSAGQAARIMVSAAGANAPQIAFRLPGAVDPSKPVLGMIDNGSPAVTQSTRFGEGGWKGDEAAKLIDAMQKGRRFNLAWSIELDSNPRTASLSLAEFAAALEDYRLRLADYRISPSGRRGP